LQPGYSLGRGVGYYWQSWCLLSPLPIVYRAILHDRNSHRSDIIPERDHRLCYGMLERQNRNRRRIKLEIGSILWRQCQPSRGKNAKRMTVTKEEHIAV